MRQIMHVQYIDSLIGAVHKIYILHMHNLHNRTSGTIIMRNDYIIITRVSKHYFIIIYNLLQINFCINIRTLFMEMPRNSIVLRAP